VTFSVVGAVVYLVVMFTAWAVIEPEPLNVSTGLALLIVPASALVVLFALSASRWRVRAGDEQLPQTKIVRVQTVCGYYVAAFPVLAFLGAPWWFIPFGVPGVWLVIHARLTESSDSRMSPGPTT
jgi:hypothetical protein